MIIYDNENQFYKWVDDKVDSLDRFMSKLVGKPHGAIYGIKWKLGTSVVCRNFIITVKENGDTIIYNTRTRRSGEARLNINDAMDYELGFALAWARYNKKEIPVVKTAIKVVNLKIGDIVKFDGSTNYIVLSIVPTTETNIAITLMPWDGNKGSFYHNTVGNIIIRHKLNTIEVVGHTNL